MRDTYTWFSIVVVVLFSTCGDVFTSKAMKGIGDLGPYYRQHGLTAAIKRVATTHSLWIGVTCMAGAFFSLLFALSWADVSLVGPAAASLTFLSNAVTAKFYLRERVDKRRWIAAALVAGGVALVAV